MRDESGALHFLGRRDNMVKSRGFRIELGDVEHAIATHPGVAEVAIVAQPDPEFGNVLYAWFVPAFAGVQPEDVARHAAQLVPGYMLPRGIYLTDRLPKTDSGKI